MAPWKSCTAVVHCNALKEKRFHSAGKWNETGHLGITLAAILDPTSINLPEEELSAFKHSQNRLDRVES